jgi:hypothetical protein
MTRMKKKRSHLKNFGKQNFDWTVSLKTKGTATI